MLQFCNLALALIKNTLKKQKEKYQKKLILYLNIAKIKVFSIPIL